MFFENLSITEIREALIEEISPEDVLYAHSWNGGLVELPYDYAIRLNWTTIIEWLLEHSGHPCKTIDANSEWFLLIFRSSVYFGFKDASMAMHFKLRWC